MTNSIEKSIALAAPRARVWRALTDHQEFGSWFGCVLDGPFEAGTPRIGQFTGCGHEHIGMRLDIADIEPQTRFSFRWHPYAIDPAVDYSGETPTLVEFTLADSPEGTLLTVVESGFDKVPAPRRAEAFRMNSRGWEMQIENISRYLEKTHA